MIILTILTTSLIHFCLKGWENVRFERGSESYAWPSLNDVSLYFVLLHHPRALVLEVKRVLGSLSQEDSSVPGEGPVHLNLGISGAAFQGIASATETVMR